MLYFLFCIVDSTVFLLDVFWLERGKSKISSEITFMCNVETDLVSVERYVNLQHTAAISCVYPEDIDWRGGSTERDSVGN